MSTHLAGGSVHISNDVLADLAGANALESFGVVGMANPNFRDGLVQLLPQNKLRKGVKVKNAVNDAGEAIPGAVDIDLYVVVEYGTQISEVSRNLADRVRYAIVSMTEIKVITCDVHVLDVRVSQGA